MSQALADLARLTGHTFANPDLAWQALTHGSFTQDAAGTNDYERLEFLGDGAVNLHAALMLAQRFPRASNAELTGMRQRVVETTALGRQGRSLGLTGHVRLGPGVGRDERTLVRITGDVVEAIFGALLEEGGFDATHRFAEAILRPLVQDIREGAPTKKAVNRLQELTQATRGTLPYYQLNELAGPEHEREFEATVSVDGAPVAHGRGRTKKEARERAAHAALIALQGGP